MKKKPIIEDEDTIVAEAVVGDIDLLTTDFGRDDLNELKNKLNEVINKSNER
jgi:hypothetical protein